MRASIDAPAEQSNQDKPKDLNRRPERARPARILHGLARAARQGPQGRLLPLAYENADDEENGSERAE